MGPQLRTPVPSRKLRLYYSVRAEIVLGIGTSRMISIDHAGSR